jgi:hypothetical protein
MVEEFIPKTNTEKIAYLMATDIRRDQHHKELKKDIAQLSENVNGLITLIAGNNLNGNKGLYILVEKIEEKVDRHDKDVAEIKQTLELVKFWGKGIAGLMFASILIIFNYFKDKI